MVYEKSFFLLFSQSEIHEFLRDSPDSQSMYQMNLLSYRPCFEQFRNFYKKISYHCKTILKEMIINVVDFFVKWIFS